MNARMLHAQPAKRASPPPPGRICLSLREKIPNKLLAFSHRSQRVDELASPGSNPVSSRPKTLGLIAGLGLMVLLLILLGGAIALFSPVSAPRATKMQPSVAEAAVTAPAFYPTPVGNAFEGPS